MMMFLMQNLWTLFTLNVEVGSKNSNMGDTKNAWAHIGFFLMVMGRMARAIERIAAKDQVLDGNNEAGA